jgi:hypothetical protein
MTISIFETRVMLKALEQMKLSSTFLRDTFFKNTTKSESENVDIDIYKGKRKISVYVSPYSQGKVRARDGYETKTYKPPYIKEKRTTTASDFFKRSIGENIYSETSPSQKASEQLAKDLLEMDSCITRAEELQAAQALFQGKVILKKQKDDGTFVNEEIDYLQADTHKITLTGNDLWSDKTNSQPLAKLRGLRRLLIQDSGVSPDVLIFSSEAIDAFLAHPDIKGIGGLSPIKVQLGQINPQLLPNGVTYWGYLQDIACDIYSYDEWYLDPSDNTEKAMVPAKKIFMGSTKARMDKLYGCIKDLSAMYPVARFPKSWEEEDPSARFLLMQSAPLLVPTQIDSFLSAQVLA